MQFLNYVFLQNASFSTIKLVFNYIPTKKYIGIIGFYGIKEA